MASILISIMIFSLLVAWTIDTHIRNFGKIPNMRRFFSFPVRKRDKRAYLVISTLGCVLFIYGMFSISDYQQVKGLLIKSTGDICLVLIYISVIVNYLIRLRIYSRTVGSQLDSRQTYIWDIWALKTRQLDRNSDRRSLMLSNSVIGLLGTFYIAWKLF